MRKALLSLKFFGIIACLFSCRTAYKTIPYSRSESLAIKLPFVKEYRKGQKAVLVYGSYHTNDTTNAEIQDIERRLNAFQPDVILYEGDYIGTEATKNASVNTYFEMGLVRWWAAQKAVNDVNLEPPAEQRYALLQRKFKTSDVLLATVLGQNTLFIQQHDKAGFEKLYPFVISDFEKEGFALTGEQKELSFFYTTYLNFYHKPFDPVTFDYETVEPKFNKTVLNTINQTSAGFRDQFMLKKIDSCLNFYNKVYVQVGGRHAIVWQPALDKIVAKREQRQG